MSSHAALVFGIVSAFCGPRVLHPLLHFAQALTKLMTDDKTVCSCSGKTVWQEREEQRDRGML